MLPLVYWTVTLPSRGYVHSPCIADDLLHLIEYMVINNYSQWVVTVLTGIEPVLLPWQGSVLAAERKDLITPTSYSVVKVRRTVRPMIDSCWCDQITRRTSRPCLDSTESCIRPSGGCRITAFEPRHIHIMAPTRDTVNRLLQNRNIPRRCLELGKNTPRGA